MTTTEIAKLMQKLSMALEKLPPDQIERLLADEVQLSISLVTVKAQREKVSCSFEPSVYVALLADASDRVQGATVLRDLTKDSLQTLAKHINLSLDSSVTKDRLVDRIVERAVGLRLRQDAFAQIA